MKRQFEFMFSWLFIMAIAGFVLFCFGKGVDRVVKWARSPKQNYSTEKPVNLDKPLKSVPYTDSLITDTTLSTTAN